jgi:osmoprotectant transport system ATP-binding protein
MIEISNLTKKFDDSTAVDNVSFSVECGESLVLLGTSGCGKTTTLKMMNRLVEPTSGKISIDGKDVQDQKPEALRMRIGYVIQNIGLFPHYTVEQSIAIVPNLLGWDKKRIAKRTFELMELVGLPHEYLRRYPNELSGGQQQRVGLARALAADPPIVLLDEPFGALDPITRRQIQAEFKNLETLLHKTMVMVTHDVFEAIDLGDKICLMDGGKIQQIDTAKGLVFSPKNEFVKNFFQAHRFQLELKVTKIKDILPELQIEDVSTKDVKSFSEEDNLLDVLETMEKSSSKDSTLQIHDASLQQPILNTTCEELLSAFYKIKSKRK